MVRKAVRSLVVLALVGAIVTPTQASAFDLVGGVNAGAVLLGTKPRFAVSPTVGLSWRTDGGFLLALQDVFSVSPATDAHGAGTYNHTSIVVGYAWKSGQLGLGPSLAIYSMPACSGAWCARLSGLSPGGQGQLDYYFAGPFGASASVNVDWLAGSTVLPAGVVATVRAGLLFRWSSK